MFPILECEDVLQVGDRTRVLGGRTYGFDNIDKIEIKTDTDDTPVEVGLGTILETELDGSYLDDVYLDTQYSSAGDKVVSLIITVGVDTHTVTKTITVVDEATDCLFSGDEDLQGEESSIMSFMPEGKNSFLNRHRVARDKILQTLDELGIRDSDGNKLTQTSIKDKEALRKWSTFLTLALIFEGEISRPDGTEAYKASKYRGFAQNAEESSVLRLDTTGDGEVDTEENFSICGAWSRRDK